ncbi:MAG: GGDEF domain-containing protein [Meiothermus sp.]|nr:GGDEF domain-containing protein [Meiothermus sp.]
MIHSSIDRLNSQAWEARLNDQALSLDLSRRALEQATRQDYPLGQGYAWRNIGFYHYQTAQYAEAAHWLRRGLELARKHDDAPLERDCLNFLSAVLAQQGEVGAALGYIEQALRINQALGDQRGVAACLDNMGYLHQRLGQDAQAVKLRQEALGISRSIGNMAREAHILVNLAANYSRLGQHAQALEAARGGLELARVHRLAQLQPLALHSLGEALGAGGEHLEALVVLQQALEQAERLGARQVLAQGWLSLGVIHLHLHQPGKALEVLGKALSEAGRLELGEVQVQLHRRLCEAHKLLGQFEKALYHHECFYALERSLRDQQALQRLSILSVQRELEKARSEAELTHLKNVRLAEALEALERADREKGVLLQELERQVTQDPLTGAYNRRYLETVLAQEFAKARAAERLLPVAILDVDDFKRINDGFSHQTGDRVLQTLTQIVKASARTGDILARYGGEEFVLVLPRASFEQAMLVCDRVRAAVQQYPWEVVHPGLRVTVSLGLAADTTLPSHEKLLDAADRKLYRAKRSGKNRLVT